MLQFPYMKNTATLPPISDRAVTDWEREELAMNNFAKEAEMVEFYDAPYREKGFAAQRKYPNEPMLRFLSTLPRGGKVLEIGCGSGANLWAIAKEGFDADGFDISPTAIALCHQTLDSHSVNACVWKGDFHERQNCTVKYDAIIDVQCLQHTDRKEVVIAEVRRLLKRDGKFFSYHLTEGSSVLFGEHPVTFLTEQSARELLHGFAVTFERYTRTYADGKVGNYLAITATKT